MPYFVDVSEKPTLLLSKRNRKGVDLEEMMCGGLGGEEVEQSTIGMQCL